MSGCSKQGGKAWAKTKTRACRAGLQFPVGCVDCKKSSYAEWMEAGAPVYLILKLAGNGARDKETGVIP
ncbi:unnamed protein product [Staurois parvus]|uniref:Uncharacterized protein n=1 Tax=Staurois parvus TaxID=386267 RepID=A0ABN9B7U6_9NEOB|nr:unnamed protein product [Staurois parvus]